MGWPIVELWVASSDTDADVFVYLEDYDPKTDKARYAASVLIHIMLSVIPPRHGLVRSWIKPSPSAINLRSSAVRKSSRGTAT